MATTLKDRLQATTKLSQQSLLFREKGIVEKAYKEFVEICESRAALGAYDCDYDSHVLQNNVQAQMLVDRCAEEGLQASYLIFNGMQISIRCNWAPSQQ